MARWSRPEGRRRRAAGWQPQWQLRLPRRAARNDTHVSTTDGEARLFRKGAGKEAKLCFMGRLLMENRSGLVVAARLTQATGLAERAAASRLIADLPGRHRITVGADRAYDTADFVAALRLLKATPHREMVRRGHFRSGHQQHLAPAAWRHLDLAHHGTYGRHSSRSWGTTTVVGAPSAPWTRCEREACRTPRSIAHEGTRPRAFAPRRRPSWR
jgi:hypothetical protein